jgi:cytochrome P450
MTATAQLSGPRGRPLTGNLADFARDPLDFLTRTAQEHGPVSSLRFARARAVLLSDPAMIEEVLVRKRLDFIKNGPIRAQHRLFGKGLLINEGESWAKQRRLTQPAFHPGNLGPYVPVVAARTSRMLDGWRDGETRDIHLEMKNLLMGIVAECLFGPTVAPRAAEIGDAVEGAMDRYAARRGTARLLPDWVPLSDSRRYLNGVREIDEFVTETVSSRRSAPSGKNDLLSMLLAARDESGQPMSPGQIRDEAINLFVGGFDTPSLVLSWTWYLLANHPEIAERVAAEADEVLGARSPELGDLQRLDFTQKVLKESMRLYPPAWLLGREPVRDVEIGGVTIPRGTIVLISQWVMHRDGRYFGQPLRFDPDRWSEKIELPRFVYFPFGAGPRVCIGAAFATLECTLSLAMIAQRFRFAMSTADAVLPQPTMTLRPKGGMPGRIVVR